MHRSRLPILSPCDQRWDAMTGTATRRHCAACDRDVLDLSAMPAVAAIDALIARDGRACIRYRTDAAGEIQFATPPRRPHPLAAAALALTACAGWSEDPETIAPDELGQCIPDAAQPNQCDLPDAPGPHAPSPAEPPRPARADPTHRDSTAPLDVPDPREFTALVEVAPTRMGDSSGVRVEDLRSLRSELTHPYGSAEATISQVGLTDDPPLATSLFDRDSTTPGDTGGIRLGMLTAADTHATIGPASDHDGVVYSRAELRRMRRELRREQRQKRPRG